MIPELKPGDIFCTRNPMWLGRAINAAQKFWSADNASEYSHAGIIIDTEGTTFEALWTVKSRNIFRDCADDQILIGRHRLMDHDAFQQGLAAVMDYQGHWYPFHRLFLHLFPPAAKYISAGSRYLVCSELTAKFLYHAGPGLVDFYRGKNPDHIADMIRRWKGWSVVYEGVLSAEPDFQALPDVWMGGI